MRSSSLPAASAERRRRPPHGLSGTHGWAAKTESALTEECVTTSDLGLRLVGQGDPVLSPDPAPDAQLSFPAVWTFHFGCCALFSTPAGGVGAPLFQLRGCTPKFSLPSPLPHSAAQDRGGCPPAFRNSLASGCPQICAQWGPHCPQQPPLRQVCGSHGEGGPATWLGG